MQSLWNLKGGLKRLFGCMQGSESIEKKIDSMFGRPFWWATKFYTWASKSKKLGIQWMGLEITIARLGRLHLFFEYGKIDGIESCFGEAPRAPTGMHFSCKNGTLREGVWTIGTFPRKSNWGLWPPSLSTEWWFCQFESRDDKVFWAALILAREVGIKLPACRL